MDMGWQCSESGQGHGHLLILLRLRHRLNVSASVSISIRWDHLLRGGEGADGDSGGN